MEMARIGCEKNYVGHETPAFLACLRALFLRGILHGIRLKNNKSDAISLLISYHF